MAKGSTGGGVLVREVNLAHPSDVGDHVATSEGVHENFVVELDATPTRQLWWFCSYD